MAALGVYECLRRAGLQQYWTNLEAAGFSTMEGLSELHQEHFPALGVDDAADRRKLFLLVQTIQRRKKQPQPPELHGNQVSVFDEKKETRTVVLREQGNRVAAAAAHTSATTARSPIDSLVSQIPSPERKGRRTNNTNVKTTTRSTGASIYSNHRPVSVFQPSVQKGNGSPRRSVHHESSSAPMDNGQHVDGAVTAAPRSRGGDSDIGTRDSFGNVSHEEDEDMPSDELRSAEETEDTVQPLQPRRSQRLMERNDGEPAIPLGGSATATAASRATSNSNNSAETSSRMSVAAARRISRLNTPKKRSAAVTRATKSVASGQLQTSRSYTSSEDDEASLETDEDSMDQDIRQGQSEDASSRTNKSIDMQGPRAESNSFQAKILALRQQTEEEHRSFTVAAAASKEKKMSRTSGQMKIRVVVRKRPMSTAETAMVGSVDVMQPLDYQSYGKMLVYQPRTRVDLTKQVETIPFCFDNVFDEKANNAQIYERCVQPLIPGLFQGQWATLFAYGQSGSGKTYTIMGSVHTTGASACNYGLYFLAAMDIFQHLRKYPEYEVGVSLFEIYGGKLFDLFNNREPVKCLEDRLGQVHFPGLSERGLRSPYDLMHWIHESSSLRSTGTTSRNADSSRSHAVLQLHLRKKSDKTEYSRMTLIDLAGSERGADTQAACRTTRMEGAEINTSLLTLKEVIRALAQGNELSHVPFRGSKLTQVLKESFVGSDCRTVMIACVSPNIGNCEHTLNTLRYANRVKERNSDTGETIAESVVVPSSPHDDDENTDEDSSDLDELLATTHDEVPQAIKSSPANTVSSQLTDRVGNSLELANAVIRSHKMSMKAMLDLTSREMDLALDSHLPTDDYLRNVDDIHRLQLEICSDLRRQIDAYRKSRSGRTAMAREAIGESDDDSIEDLRD